MTKGLRLSEWSQADRACWERVLAPTLSADGLRPSSISAYFKLYRQWLTHLKSSGVNDYISPLTPIVPDIGRRFVDDIRSRTSAQTAFTEAYQLGRMIKIVEPDATPLWLAPAIKRFARELKRPARLAVPPSSDRILREARRMMNLGRRLFDRPDRTDRTAVRGRDLVRDGFMLALLAMRPLRLRNFAELCLGKNIIFYGSGAWIRVAEYESKTGAPFEVPFPRQLVAGLRYYLDGPRLAFPNARLLSALWISDRGTPMSDAVASRIIRLRTLEIFGAPVSAHQFRHAAVTFLAEKHPELIALAPDILGHANVRIAEQFYNLASPKTGASTLQRTLIGKIDRTRTRGEEIRRH